jgi:hypothetical protein
MGLSAWVGPAIIATPIASLVQIIGWQIEHRHERRRQTDIRREKIVDVQTVIRAEIRSHRRLLQFLAVDLSTLSSGPEDDFLPVVPSEVRPFVLDAILRDIHILPTDVIDPVIVYYRQVEALIRLVEDLRSERFREMTGDRRVAMYRDYIGMGVYAAELAADAIAAINRDLGVADRVSSSGADRSDPRSGAAGPAAGGEAKRA